MQQTSPQPNVFATGGTGGLPLRFWVLVVLTGIGTGLGAAALMLLLRAVQHAAFSYHSGDFLHAVQRSPYSRRVLVLLGAGALVGVGRRLLRFAPGGHGGELSEAIWFRSGRMPFLQTIARGALSMVLVGLGASIGRKGAPKQTGAAIAGKLAEWARLSPAQCRLLTACGAGAGMAAVYNVPFGGALFALEVLLGSLALPLVLPALATSLIATAVAWISLPMQPTYSVPTYHLAGADIGLAAVVGPLAGLASVAYVRAIGWAEARKPQGVWAIATPLLVFAALGSVAIVYPQLLGNGKDVVQLAFVGQMAVPLLAAVLILKPLATVACLGSGAPGGLFTPTMTYGAVLGALLGHAWAAVWPEAQIGSYAIIGAGAVLAASTQGPVSAIVLMLELTRRIDALMVPLMLAVAGATLVARLLDPRSIYSIRIKIGMAAAVPAAPARTRFDDRISDDYATVSSGAPYAAVLEHLLDQSGRGWPLYVLDEHGQLLGEIPARPAGMAASASPPLETATASDLALPVQALVSSMSAADVAARLDAAPAAELPVTDAASGRLIGVVRRKRPAGAADQARLNPG